MLIRGESDKTNTRKTDKGKTDQSEKVTKGTMIRKTEVKRSI